MTKNADEKQLTLISLSLGSTGINGGLGSNSAPFPFVSASEMSLCVNAYVSTVCAFTVIQKTVYVSVPLGL